MMLAALAFGLNLAYADSSTTPPPKPKPSVSKVEGQPVVVTWPSGNVAELRLRETPPLEVLAPFEVSENSCQANSGQKFSMKLYIEQKEFLFVWTKHSDPAKIGRILTQGGDLKVPLALNFLFNNDSKMSKSGLGEDLPSDKIEISDASWLPGMEDGQFRSFTIDTWFTERMIKNPQTGVSENRIVVELDGLKFQSMDASHGEEVKVDAMTRTSGSGFGYFNVIGDVVTWLISTPLSECQISSKPNSAFVEDQVTKYLSHPDQTNKVYLWKQDALSNTIDAPNDFLFQELENVDE